MGPIAQFTLSLVLVLIAYRAGKAEGWREGYSDATRAALDMVRAEIADRQDERATRSGHSPSQTEPQP